MSDIMPAAQRANDLRDARRQGDQLTISCIEAEINYERAAKTRDESRAIRHLDTITELLKSKRRNRDPLLSAIVEAVADLVTADCADLISAADAAKIELDTISAQRSRRDNIPRPSNLQQSEGAFPAGYRPPSAAQVARANARGY